MKSQADRETVIALSASGQSIRQISRLLKMSRKTIRRILDGKEPHPAQRPSRYEGLAPLVCELFQQFAGNAVLIQNALQKEYGHRIAYASLTRLVRQLKLREDKSKRSGSFAYAPGQEAQHDTSPHRVLIADKAVKAHCASLVLANSRLLFMQYYPRFTRFEAKIFLSAALDYFDGAPQACVIDNTSVMVAAGSGADAIIAPEMEAFAGIYGMRFVAHAVGHANRSALVERNFHYIENNFLPGQRFPDWKTLNEAARSWCDAVANDRIKRALGMTPRQAYQSERPFLRPLPAVKPPVYQALSRTVDMYGFVTVDTNRYSVPERLCGKLVEVHKGLYDIKIFHRHRLAASHKRLIDQRDAKLVHPGHHLPPVRRANAPSPLMRLLTGHSETLTAYVAKIASSRRSTATRLLQRLLALKRAYPRQAFDQAVERALFYGVYDLSRLENIILTFVAGDFFKLDDHEPDNGKDH